MKKRGNAIAQKKHEIKVGKSGPNIYSICDLTEKLRPFMEVPPLEELNRSFILNHMIGNGTAESPIFIVISTHGLLANGPA